MSQYQRAPVDTAPMVYLAERELDGAFAKERGRSGALAFVADLEARANRATHEAVQRELLNIPARVP